MSSESAQEIVSLFQVPSKQTRKNVERLVDESFSILGVCRSVGLMKEWEKLSSKLSSLRQLQSLSDKNHRLLLIHFIKDQAVELYNNSYFNHAKIAEDYITFIQKLGPFHFSEIVTIVSKMKLITKHYQGLLSQGKFSENHIDIKIMQLLEMCKPKPGKRNKNLHKFQAIVEFQEERNQLTKQLGKMLRNAWTLEKRQQSRIYQQRKKEGSVRSDIPNNCQSMHKSSQNGDNYSDQSYQLYLCKCGKE